MTGERRGGYGRLGAQQIRRMGRATEARSERVDRSGTYELMRARMAGARWRGSSSRR